LASQEKRRESSRVNDDASDDLAGEGGPTSDEAVEMQGLVQDLFGMRLSVTVEADPPVTGTAERMAEEIRTALGEPDCRIQVSDDCQGATIGPTERDAEDPQGALELAMATLGGKWDDVVATDTEMGPVLYTARPADESHDEVGFARIHLWAGVSWALIKYAEQLQESPEQVTGPPAPPR
jgi:hypothetical protein